MADGMDDVVAILGSGFLLGYTGVSSALITQIPRFFMIVPKLATLTDTALL